MKGQHKLFGIPGSLYTAKVRSYFRKQAIPFEETGPWDQQYQQEVLPQIGRMIMPVLACPDGTVVQDGADILRHCSNAGLSRYPLLPASPMLRSIAYLFELFGGEGLLRPAMHYRWNFDEINLDTIRSEFRCLFPAHVSDADYENLWQAASGQMRAATTFFGASVENATVIESACAEFLRLLSEHLVEYPYILGFEPTLADFSLMGPMYGHLYRDPHPAQVMRRTAPRVARWVERVNSGEENRSEYAQAAMTPMNDNQLPDTLIQLLEFIATEYLPEITAHVTFANQWLDDQPDLSAGTNGLDDPAQRFIGMAEFEWRDRKLTTVVMPYRFYLLQVLQSHYDEASHEAQQTIKGVYQRTGLASLLNLRTRRPVERRNHLEVWGELIE